MTSGAGPDDSVWAVLPVKPFAEAKTRLAPSLTPAQRETLVRHLLARTVAVLSQSRTVHRSLIVSRDPEAYALARTLGVEALPEPPPGGLNGALRAAAAYTEAAGADGLLVLATDLPLLTPADVDAFVLQSEGRSVTIAADRRGEGTNALVLRPPTAIDFAFGPESLGRHIALTEAQGGRAEVCRLEGLATDLDVPEDFDVLSTLGWSIHEIVAAS